MAAGSDGVRNLAQRWLPDFASRVSRAITLTGIMCCLSMSGVAPAQDETLRLGAPTLGRIKPDGRVVRNVVVRQGASTATPALAALGPGEELPFISQVPRWYKVRLPGGREGYVSKAWTLPLGDREGPFTVHVIDVGTGLAIFVEGPDFTLLYDAGSQDDSRRKDRNRVVSYLRKVRPDLQVIDHLILSHAHKDHLWLMPDVFDSYVVRNVWDSGRLDVTPVFSSSWS